MENSRDVEFRFVGSLGTTEASLPDGRAAGAENFYADAPVALCVLDRQGRYLAANRALAAICGLPREAIVGRRMGARFPLGIDNATHCFGAFDAGGAVDSLEQRWNGKDYMISVKPVRDRAGRTAALSVALVDITDRKRRERHLEGVNRRLRSAALLDYLTGLPNRRSFEVLLRSHLRRSLRQRKPLSLVVFDVDCFKAYNDRYGHPAGDRCLRRLAEATEAVLSDRDNALCRYGGEEFVAILPDTGRAEVVALAESLRKAVADLDLPHEESPFQRVTISLGSATAFEPSGKLSCSIKEYRSALLAMTDRALYSAKLAGRNCHRSAAPGSFETWK